MSALWARIRSEPAMVASVISIGLAQATTFGLNLTDDQVGQIWTLASLLLGVAVRQQVEPLSKQSPAGKAKRKSSRKEKS